MIETKKSFCRFCHAYCAIEVDIEENRAVAVRGDASDPIYGGYTCIKGRHLDDQHNHPDRIRSTQRRRPDGTFEAIGSEQALDEIAAKLTTILEERGPRAVALWGGAGGALMSLSIALTFLPAADPTDTSASARRLASSCVFMNAPRPTFTSSTSASMPSASFLLRMLATINGIVSTVAVTSRSA